VERALKLFENQTILRKKKKFWQFHSEKIIKFAFDFQFPVCGMTPYLET